MRDFDAFPTGKKRKEIVADNQDGLTSFKKVGKDLINFQGHYTILDSNISGSESFEHSFIYVLPRVEGGLQGYIEKTLEKRKGQAVGVEFGGVGTNLFSGFSPNFFKHSIGVTLIDHRTEDLDLHTSKEDDAKINHEVLEGDIFDPQTYKSLNEKLNSEKVDLIISRMLKGLEFVPLDPYTVSKILQTWYSMLNKDGVMFVQTPIAFNELLEKWSEKIQKEFKDQIEIDYKKGNISNLHPQMCSVFRLKKLDGAPEDLPLLDPKTVRRIEKYRPFRW